MAQEWGNAIRRSGNTGKRYLVLIAAISFAVLALLPVCCSNSGTVNGNGNDNDKVSSLLLTQVNLRQEQIAEPTAERLEMMRAMGMSVDNLGIQRIYIHLTKELSALQIEELEAMGITLYLDSWIPPVGVHPTGFLLADMPVEKLEELAGKDYIVELDTAERQLEPQNGSQPQSG